jgi:hypothetical protein
MPNHAGFSNLQEPSPWYKRRPDAGKRQTEELDEDRKKPSYYKGVYLSSSNHDSLMQTDEIPLKDGHWTRDKRPTQAPAVLQS